MKKVLFSLSLLASLAAFAADEIDADAQIFGVLPITSSSTNVIVSIPWVTPGYDNGAISVSNLIKTANLTVNDTLKAYDSTKGSYNVWTLREGAGGVKYWSGVTIVGTNGTSKSESADLTALARGNAVILTRQNPGTLAAPATFYVYGQYAAIPAAGVVISIATGTKGSPAYTLIAPPYTVNCDLNNDATWTGLTYGGVSNDKIYICSDASKIGPTFRTYDSKAATWGYDGAEDWVADAPVKVGTGCWYVSTGTNSAVTVKFNAK